MADFPSSPSNGDTHIIGNTIWVYNSGVDSWLIQDVNEYAVANLQNTPPANPDEGTLWYDSQTTGRLFIFINGAWIDASPGDNSDLVGGNDVTVTQANNQYTIDVDDSFVRNTGDTMTGTLTMSGATPEIHFNGTSDAGIDMAIKATPEGLDFYEPEDGNKVHFQILDDTGVDAPFGYKVNGGTVIDSSRNVTATNATFDAGTSTTVNVKCDDAGLAMVRANGDNQGTGALEVGQSNSYGGGMSYNGDGSPAFVSGETSDRITFYRLDAGNRYEVFSYAYNSANVEFNGNISAPGRQISAGSFVGDGSGLTNLPSSGGGYPNYVSSDSISRSYGNYGSAVDAFSIPSGATIAHGSWSTTNSARSSQSFRLRCTHSGGNTDVFIDDVASGGESGSASGSIAIGISSGVVIRDGSVYTVIGNTITGLAGVSGHSSSRGGCSVAMTLYFDA